MIKRLTALLIAILVLVSFGINAKADDVPELIKIRCTCYCYTGNPTKSGCMPYEGIASSNYYYGKTFIIYDLDMNYIGVFEVKDTGSAKSLKNGTSIDVYRNTLAGCYDWVAEYGDYVYIQLIPAVG